MWYVEFLLLNSNEIKSGADIDSDTYNDLLIIEKQINAFKELGVLTKEEENILSEIFISNSFDAVEKSCGINRQRVPQVFRQICAKIALSLGGVFTDEGYLNYMEEKYNLSSEQICTLRDYIKSKFRYKVMREPYNKEN